MSLYSIDTNSDLLNPPEKPTNINALSLNLIDGLVSLLI